MMGFAAGLLVFFGFPVQRIFVLHAHQHSVSHRFGCVSDRDSGLGALGQGRRCQHFRCRIKSAGSSFFRKEYRYYYLVTMISGVQKQIALVFGSWVIIEILGKKADTMSLLMITVSFISIFFMNMLGRWIDRFGVKKMMYLDALTFIGIYIIYGFVVWGITGKVITGTWPMLAIYALFVMDRLSFNMGMVKSVYLRSIAVNKEEITSTLSAGTSLDHVVAILAAQLSGLVWTLWGTAMGVLYRCVFLPWQPVRRLENPQRSTEIHPIIPLSLMWNGMLRRSSTTNQPVYKTRSVLLDVSGSLISFETSIALLSPFNTGGNANNCAVFILYCDTVSPSHACT